MEIKDENQEDIEACRLAKANKAVINCHLITVTVLTLAYCLEVFKGAKTAPYLCMLALLGYAPAVTEFFLYRKNQTHFMIKYLVPFGYAAMYMAILFTTDNVLAFVYALPMLIAVTVYNDFRYCAKIGAAVVLVNAAHVVYFYGKDGFEPAEISSAEIQIAVLIIVVLFSCYTASVSNQMSRVEIRRAEEEKERSGRLLEKTLQTSAGMTKVIDAVSGEMAALLESVQGTRTAMDELAGGTQDTADAVQRQMEQTEEITERIGQVEEAAGQIAGSMEKAREAIGAGTGRMEYLVGQVARTEQMSGRMAQELSQLKEDVAQMGSILEMIRGITSQTSLLSLNASIEAARAGEAGRGFSVVASEISGLASQTQDATVNIEKRIQDVSVEIGKVVQIIEEMIGMIGKQNEAVGKTAQSFEEISAHTGAIGSYSGGLLQAVEGLSTANRLITDNVQTVSAVSEEVAAHTNSTYESCVENEKTIGRLTEQADILTGLAKRLNA